jgi:hypothetical protein
VSRASAITNRASQLLTGYAARVEWLVGPRFIPASPDFSPELVETIRRVRPYTMTTARRLAALCDAVEYVARANISGALVECGVWRGGSMMAAALTLLRVGDTQRDLYLFDTFEGMPAPGERDVKSWYDGYSPLRRWSKGKREAAATDTQPDNAWHYVPVDRVRATLESTGYPPERLHLVAGMVEDTIPAHAPERIALLRLDTDWYASTRHELEQLFPRLADGGVLIIDDYGHYEGARQAVDEYFQRTGQRILLNRIDYTGRIAVKQGHAT